MHVPQTEVILSHAGAELARVTLPPGEYVIGRDASAGIHADTPLLSRRHALLTIQHDTVLIEDLASSNGTFVDEQPVAGTARLFPGHSVRLGDVTLDLNREAPTLALSPAPADATLRHLVPEEVLAEKRYGLAKRSPFLAFGMMTAMLSLAGIPFTAGFYGKFLVFAAAVKEHQFVLIGIGIITVAAGFYYYLRVVAAMYWQEPNDDTPIRIGGLTKATVGALTALIFIVGIFPQPVLSMLRERRLPVSDMVVKPVAHSADAPAKH